MADRTKGSAARIASRLKGAKAHERRMPEGIGAPAVRALLPVRGAAAADAAGDGAASDPVAAAEAAQRAPEVAGNFVTYAETQLDALDERPFCAVDSLVLSWLAYFRLPADDGRFATWEGAPVRELLRAECYESMFGGTWDPEGSRALLCAVCASPRFRTMRVAGYTTRFDEGQEEQFAAMTFRLGDGSAYIAFRGTDSTIVGWKEDFNMAFQSPVPAQESAARYLVDAATALPGPLYVGGHSKGGNLAVYASIMCPHAQQDRIVRAFSHDGPGFNERFLRGAGFARMRERIDKTLPQSSVFGMIFEDQEDYAIVESTGFSLLQHNPFTWVVEGADFKRVERISAGARYLDSTLADWLRGVSPDQRGRFIDALFSVLDVTDAERFADVRADWRENVPKMIAAAGELDPETRALIIQTLKVLARSATVGRASAAAGRAAEILDQISDAASSVASRVSSMLPGSEERGAAQEDGDGAATAADGDADAPVALS